MNALSHTIFPTKAQLVKVVWKLELGPLSMGLIGQAAFKVGDLHAYDNDSRHEPLSSKEFQFHSIVVNTILGLRRVLLRVFLYGVVNCDIIKEEDYVHARVY